MPKRVVRSPRAPAVRSRAQRAAEARAVSPKRRAKPARAAAARLPRWARPATVAPTKGPAAPPGRVVRVLGSRALREKAEAELPPRAGLRARPEAHRRPAQGRPREPSSGARTSKTERRTGVSPAESGPWANPRQPRARS